MNRVAPAEVAACASEVCHGLGTPQQEVHALEHCREADRDEQHGPDERDDDSGERQWELRRLHRRWQEGAKVILW